MSSSTDAQIPDRIHDSTTGTTYSKERFFGKGGFGKCYELFDCTTNGTFAGKIVSKKLLTKQNQKDKMVQEINIHKTLNHKHVVKFHRFFEDNNFVYILLELCRKRSMLELHKRRNVLTEPEVRYFMKQILEGVLYLHDLQIIHRDLKLGNLFLNDKLQVKIGDFGLATKIERVGQRKNTLCGTPNYIAPEILTKKGHSFEVDVWSIGCIMYTMLVGKPPFETNSLKETYAKIKRCEYHLPNHLPKATAHMLHQMLIPEPSRRPTVRQLLHMEFMHNGYCPKELPASCLTTAPHFESFSKCSNNRKPLVEVNHAEKISVATKSGQKPRMSVFASSSGPTIASATAQQCNNYLEKLRVQLSDLLKQTNENNKGLVKIMNAANLEEVTDPDAQPFVWVSKWVDYSDRYGFGYQLCDDGFGVMFNDSSKIVMLANERNIHYIDKDGAEHFYVLNSTPTTLDKKMKLLLYFKRYMAEHLMKTGASIPIQESDDFSRIPHLHQWHRSSAAIALLLTNGTFQINFVNHRKLVLCPLMQAVTCIENSNKFQTFRFSTLSERGFPGQEMHDDLAYALRKIEKMLNSS